MATVRPGAGMEAQRKTNRATQEADWLQRLREDIQRVRVGGPDRPPTGNPPSPTMMGANSPDYSPERLNNSAQMQRFRALDRGQGWQGMNNSLNNQDLQNWLGQNSQARQKYATYQQMQDDPSASMATARARGQGYHASDDQLAAWQQLASGQPYTSTNREHPKSQHPAFTNTINPQQFWQNLQSRPRELAAFQQATGQMGGPETWGQAPAPAAPGGPVGPAQTMQAPAPGGMGGQAGGQMQKLMQALGGFRDQYSGPGPSQNQLAYTQGMAPPQARTMQAPAPGAFNPGATAPMLTNNDNPLQDWNESGSMQLHNAATGFGNVQNAMGQMRRDLDPNSRVNQVRAQRGMAPVYQDPRSRAPQIAQQMGNAGFGINDIYTNRMTPFMAGRGIDYGQGFTDTQGAVPAGAAQRFQSAFGFSPGAGMGPLSRQTSADPNTWLALGNQFQRGF